MVYCEGKLLGVEDKENKGFKYKVLIVEARSPRYPDIVKFRENDDYKKYITKDKAGNEIVKCPLYLNSWDSRSKKFNSLGVNLNLDIAKA